MHFSPGIWHNPLMRALGGLISFVFFTTALVYMVAGLSPAATWAKTISVIAGVSAGVTVGAIPDGVDGFHAGREAEGGADGSLFGDGPSEPAP